MKTSHARGPKPSAPRPESRFNGIATCVGCGCDDMHACMTDRGPCYWLRLDREAGRGVCNACPEHIPAWDMASMVRG